MNIMQSFEPPLASAHHSLNSLKLLASWSRNGGSPNLVGSLAAVFMTQAHKTTENCTGKVDICRTGAGRWACHDSKG